MTSSDWRFIRSARSFRSLVMSLKNVDQFEARFGNFSIDISIGVIVLFLGFFGCPAEEFSADETFTAFVILKFFEVMRWGETLDAE